MMRRKPIARTAFARHRGSVWRGREDAAEEMEGILAKHKAKAEAAAAQAEEKPPLPPPPRLARPPVPWVISSTPTPMPKDGALQSKPYRRAVASLPCANCRIEGYSQHAHCNGDGKGKGLKCDDREAMPLCADRPCKEGCHTQFDQYRLLPGGREAHDAQGRAWAKQTRARVKALGVWPPQLPLWPEEQA